jgi:hypothetical protein
MDKIKGTVKEGTWAWARYQAERLGKKVKSSTWKDGTYIEFAFPYYYEELGDKAWLNTALLDADDWEVYEEEKDWSLADNITAPVKGELAYTNDVTIKCRDLILKDIEELYTENGTQVCERDFKEIVNDRFGDLV